ncbi:S8 family serine peptidase [Paenibacillus sp. P26]|nr:S8 family serine peptidase [Paenibacillus sp. P26]
MSEAWDTAQENRDMVIAIVDTGIDLNHPDLKANLVPGVNLVNPKPPPQDDNGHGTNVAGIIAAVGGNDRGVAGMLWKAKLMPVKALESDGSGGEQKLGEGIRYAVDHGAKIVVLSLGLNKYSSYMSDIVRYAEERDVLLVVATGNEGNRVKYPAAYPTVLAVGGVDSDGTVDVRSNTGPEIDVVAPWDVFTTAKGGDYEYKDGTSMAAPQVAARCALLGQASGNETVSDPPDDSPNGRRSGRTRVGFHLRLRAPESRPADEGDLSCRYVRAQQPQGSSQGHLDQQEDFGLLQRRRRPGLVLCRCRLRRNGQRGARSGFELERERPAYGCLRQIDE